jgi:GTP-binding protein
MIRKATFLVSNSDLTKCPKPDRAEIAFIGRSNVGKSSLINMLTGVKELAKTSQKPGKTQLINHFTIDDRWYLVDLQQGQEGEVGENDQRIPHHAYQSLRGVCLD